MTELEKEIQILLIQGYNLLVETLDVQRKFTLSKKHLSVSNYISELALTDAINPSDYLAATIRDMRKTLEDELT